MSRTCSAKTLPLNITRSKCNKPAERSERLKSDTLHKLNSWYRYHWQAQQLHKQDILNTEELFLANKIYSLLLKKNFKTLNSIFQPMDFKYNHKSKIFH